MNETILKSISDKLTILIRLQTMLSGSEKLSVKEILELTEDMNLSDVQVASMFGISPQTIRNTRSRKKSKAK